MRLALLMGVLGGLVLGSSGLSLQGSAAAQSGRVAEASGPPMPYEDVGACPFEGCVYRQWTANAPVDVRSAIGLLVAFVGPPLVALWGPRLTNAVGTLAASLLGLLGITAIVAFVLTLVLGVEHAPLASVGLHPPRWQAIVWGLALAAFFIYVFTPVVLWALARLRLGSFEAGLATVEPVPTWLLALTILVVASAEEILYRGYAVERLAAMSGSDWIAGSISVLAFGAAHLPNWGLGAALSTLVSGAILTAIYLWQRDLTANIVAHLVTDVVGLIVMPALARATARRQSAR